jgi:cholesterol transport system auxiliary component
MRKASVRNVVLAPLALTLLAFALLALMLLAAGCLSRPALVRQDFLLQTPPLTHPAVRPIGGVLTLTSCNVSPPFAGQALVYRIGPSAFETDPYAGFLVPPDETLAIAMRDWLARSGLFTSVAEPGGSSAAGQTLHVFVDELYGDLRAPGRPQAVLSLGFVLLGAKTENGSQVLFQKEYSRHLPVPQNTAAAIVAGWNQALGEIMDEFASDLKTYKSAARNSRK